MGEYLSGNADIQVELIDDHWLELIDEELATRLGGPNRGQNSYECFRGFFKRESLYPIHVAAERGRVHGGTGGWKKQHDLAFVSILEI